jgi:acyl-CoA synthetase (AMP-forming)/AMP-acid ligase II
MKTQAALSCYTSGTTGHPERRFVLHRSNVLHGMMMNQPDVMGESVPRT